MQPRARGGVLTEASLLDRGPRSSSRRLERLTGCPSPSRLCSVLLRRVRPCPLPASTSPRLALYLRATSRGTGLPANRADVTRTSPGAEGRAKVPLRCSYVLAFSRRLPAFSPSHLAARSSQQPRLTNAFEDNYQHTSPHLLSSSSPSPIRTVPYLVDYLITSITLPPRLPRLSRPPYSYGLYRRVPHPPTSSLALVSPRPPTTTAARQQTSNPPSPHQTK